MNKESIKETAKELEAFAPPTEEEIKKVTSHLVSLLLAPPKSLEKYGKQTAYSLDLWLVNLVKVIHEAIRLDYTSAWVMEQVTHDVMDFWRLWFFDFKFTPRISSFAEELPKREKKKS